MSSRSSVKTPKNQQGLALLILIIVIVLAFATYSLSGLSINQVKTDNKFQTRMALKKAKQALLAYAMNYPDTAAGILNPNQGPGNFPCPDDDLDGDSDTPGSVLPGCNSAGDGTMGRFPWAELGMDEVRDGNGDFLWYAVSSNFTNFANGNINTSTTGEITIRNSDGTVQFDGAGINGVVAVVISPGVVLVRGDGLTQRRSTVAEIDDPQNYLDIAFGEDNATYVNSDADGFITAPVRNAAGDIMVNDQIVTISYEEVMRLVHARAGDEMALALSGYASACGAYPEASIFDPTKSKADGSYLSDAGIYEGHIPVDSINWDAGGCANGLLPDWIEAEEWHKETYYHYAETSPGCTPADCLHDVSIGLNNIDALIVFSGRQIGAQLRGEPGSDIADYFVGENNNGDLIYNATEVEDYIRVIAP